jgi:ribosomal protein S1
MSTENEQNTTYAASDGSNLPPVATNTPAPVDTTASAGANHHAAPPADHAEAPSTSENAGDDPAGDEPESGEEAAADAAQPGAPQGAAPGQPGTGKRKRRRRKKKKPGDAGAAAGTPSAEGGEGAGHAEGEEAHAEGDARAHGEGGGENPEGRRDKNDKKRDRGPRPPREPRERPAFGVGDVVFGKILEIQDEALIVDLSGKARAIFDRAELTIPEEPANQPVEDEDAPGAPVIPAALREGEASPLAETKPAEGQSAAAPPAAASADASSAAPAPEPEPAAEETQPEEAAAATEADDDKEPPPPEEPAYLPPVVLEVGASFVGVVHSDGSRGGLVVITRHPRRASRAKPKVFEAFKNNEKETILGLVTGVIKGGVEVDIDGLRAFAPGSHMDTRLGADLHYLVGKRLNFSVTQYGKKGRDIVLSRKKFIEVESKAARIQALAKLDIGGEIEGIVRSIVPFGAFVDVGGIEGLIPLAEMSHNRSDTPHDVFQVGEPTTVKIVKVDEKGKVWLSHKATIADPWLEAVKRYAQTTKHKGKIVRLQPFGAFVELEPGIDGLIHTSDLSLKRIEHPSEVVKVGDELDVVVSSVDAHAHKIALHPAPSGEAEGEMPQRVILHKPVKVKVVAIEQNGLVVRVMGATGRHARGYIPAGGTGTQRGTELRKVFKEGQEIDAKVIDIDPKRGEVKLSIRALNEDTERSAYKTYQQQVKKEAKFTMGDLLAKKLQK